MTESGPHELIGKRIRVKDHPQAPREMVGIEGKVIDYRALEPTDDDLLLVELDDGRQVFVPVDAAEVVAT